MITQEKLSQPVNIMLSRGQIATLLTLIETRIKQGGLPFAEIRELMALHDKIKAAVED